MPEAQHPRSPCRLPAARVLVALVALLPGACSQAPLQPFSTDTPPVALVPAAQAGVHDERARFREIYCAVPERISQILQPSYRKLSQIDGRNDSQVIFYDQLIPGSTLAAYLNADHWAIAVPIARSHATVGALFVTQNAYPREALLEATLRFIEEDLGRPPR